MLLNFASSLNLNCFSSLTCFWMLDSFHEASSQLHENFLVTTKLRDVSCLLASVTGYWSSALIIVVSLSLVRYISLWCIISWAYLTLALSFDNISFFVLRITLFRCADVRDFQFFARILSLLQ